MTIDAAAMLHAAKLVFESAAFILAAILTNVYLRNRATK
jgi:hypothetical protein